MALCLPSLCSVDDTSFRIFFFTKSYLEAVPKQVKAGSPSLSSAPQPGILSTVSLNRGNEALPLPGPPLANRPLANRPAGTWWCLLCAWTESPGCRVLMGQAPPHPLEEVMWEGLSQKPLRGGGVGARSSGFHVGFLPGDRGRMNEGQRIGLGQRFSLRASYLHPEIFGELVNMQFAPPSLSPPPTCWI